MINYEDFEKVDIRVGRVLSADEFPEGRYSSHILKIDFGKEVGIKKSLARLTPNYKGPELVGKLVSAVVNFPPKQIGTHFSEVLTLGFSDENGDCILIFPGKDIPLGGKLH